MINDCKSIVNCKRCKGRHNTLLHKETNVSNKSEATALAVAGETVEVRNAGLESNDYSNDGVGRCICGTCFKVGTN